MIQKKLLLWAANRWQRADHSFVLSGRNPAATARLIPGVVCSVAILFGLLMQCELRLPGSSRFGVASAQVAAVHQPFAIQTQSPVYLSVDATKHSPNDSAAFKAFCGKLTQASGVRPAGVPRSAEPGDGAVTPPEQYSETPDWYLWAQLNNQCSGSAKPTDLNKIQMYAVHSEAGGAICLANSSSDRTPYVLKLRLPKGVFRIERLSFRPTRADGNKNGDKNKNEDGSSNAAAYVSLTHEDNHTYISELRRLEGCDNAQASTISKRGELVPGEISIIRFTDVARSARVAFANLKNEIHNLASSTPGPAERLGRIVAEGDSYTSGVIEGTSSSCQKRLGCVHRLILLMSQAESLHRNFQSRQIVNADPGAKTMGALERIEDSLAETSAVLSGLVPQIELGPFTRTQPGGTDGAIEDRTIETVVTVSLVNSGAHSVDSVKLGIDASALPDGSTCWPDDPAYFGSLHPGQSVRAEFKLKLIASDQTAPARFVADVSYFTSGAPAHLRPRPW